MRRIKFYSVMVNNDCQEYTSRSAALRAIEKYAESNSIHSLSFCKHIVKPLKHL